MTRAEILDTAKSMVTGQREQDYGKPEDNFSTIAKLWNGYMEAINFVPLQAEDVAHMMVLFKLGRIITGTGTEDSFIDAAGYIACAGEIVTGDGGNK